MMAAARRVLRAVAFDMDGTLTVPCIDFQLMRERAGILEGDILEVLATMDAERQAEARAAIWEVEQQALKDMRLMPGVQQLCSFLDSEGIPRGLITRNVKHSVDHFHARAFSGQAFEPALGRECGVSMEPPLRFKPHPDALLHVCSRWGVDPQEAMFVGDSPKDDVVCGNRAGCWTVLFDEQNQWGDDQLTGEMAADFTIRRMDELVPLLQKHFDLQSPLNPESPPAVIPGVQSSPPSSSDNRSQTRS